LEESILVPGRTPTSGSRSLLEAEKQGNTHMRVKTERTTLINKDRVKATFHTFDRDLIRILRQMVKDGLAFECPKDHIHLIYPLEEYGHKIFRERNGENLQ